MKRLLLLGLLLITSLAWAQKDAPGRWSRSKANSWYGDQPWLFGPNYVPANAINQLEMFQPETFDPATIDKELGWAEAIGVNTLRVFLHDLLWERDEKSFKTNLDTFLSICEKHNIRPMLVLFDSCWDPFPKMGKQLDPKPGVHNSGWLQSPGAEALADDGEHHRLESYVKGVVGAFRKDKRILAWDVWNEPDNPNTSSYGQHEPAGKADLVARLLPQVFQWARLARPIQPLTSAVWVAWENRDWSNPAAWKPIETIQLENSDFITFHHYADVASFQKMATALQQTGRPVVCTEFLARSVKSQFQTHLPVAKKLNVGMMNWGFVAGKTQTFLPWDSWEKPYASGRQPSVWHHEILTPDGKPYLADEVEVIRKVTGKK
ncbi:hypothetical protein GCM10023189_22220 [Nibrella saemangeumensis]|uniref:Cellulase (Glycosyl hydrolase family 5) n=1 Tax=Nibrella saemangeumensis TaxID=1084526 RepID=A0ABP8MV29_9BACT